MNLYIYTKNEKIIKIDYHDISNIYVKWRLESLFHKYLDYYQPNYVVLKDTTSFSSVVEKAANRLNIDIIKTSNIKEKEIIQQFDITDVLILFDKNETDNLSSQVLYECTQNNINVINLWNIWEKNKKVSFPFANTQTCSIEHKNIVYPSVENFYQAMKTEDIAERIAIAKLSPWDAKLKGSTIEVSQKFIDNRERILTYGLNKKFENPRYANLLWRSGRSEIIYWNLWHDNYLGYCYCNSCKEEEKLNILGTIIMDIREKLENDY